MNPYSKSKFYFWFLGVPFFTILFINCTSASDYCTNLNSNTVYFSDNSNQLKFSEAISKLNELELNKKEIYSTSIGYSEATHWFKFQNINIDEDNSFLGVRRWYLVLDNPLIDEVSVLIPREGNFTQLISGDQIPFTKRDLPLVSHTFRIPNDVKINEIYVKLISKGSLRVNFSRCRSEELLSFESSTNIQYGFLFGSIVFITVYHLITFFLSRRFVFVMFSLYSISIMFFFMTTSGYSQKFFYPSLADFNNNVVQYSNILSISLGFTFILFYFPFLAQGKFKTLFSVPIFLFLLAHLILIPWISYTYLSRTIPVFGVLITISLTTILFFRKNLRPSERWIQIGLAVLSIAIIISILRLLTVIPNNMFTIHIIKISQLTEVLLFALAVGSQYNELKSESDRTRIEKETAIRLAQAKTDTLNYLSHEIRSPLHSIMAYVEILSEKAKDSKTKDEVHYLMKSSHHLIKILSDVLDQSKIEAGKIKIEYGHFVLLDFVDEIIGEIKPIASQHNLDLELEIDPKVPTKIYADSIHLHQVLSNLLFNAVKFTKHGYVKLKLLKYENHIHFYVIDTGVGMGYDDQVLLFNEFTQNAKTFYRKYGGSGLGLMIAKGLLELMGSELTLKSEKNKGTEFHFSIPIHSDLI